MTLPAPAVMLAARPRIPTGSRGTLIQEKTMLSADYQFLEAITAAESVEFDQHALA